MGDEHALDLPRRDVGAAAHDNFLLASDKPDVPVDIAARDVARVYPAILQHFRRRFLVPPVAAHGGWSLDQEFTGRFNRRFATLRVNDFNVDSVYRQADRAGANCAIRGLMRYTSGLRR